MENGALCRVAELSADARHAMEVMLGRPLGDDEAIAVNVYKPAPTGAARDEASRRLRERIDKTAQRAQSISETEIDAAIDEAVDHVRHYPG